jgi:Zn-dependent protease with chaperone function
MTVLVARARRRVRLLDAASTVVLAAATVTAAGVWAASTMLHPLIPAAQAVVLAATAGFGVRARSRAVGRIDRVWAAASPAPVHVEGMVVRTFPAAPNAYLLTGGTPRLLLSDDLTAGAPKVLDAVIAHERSHLTSGDRAVGPVVDLPLYATMPQPGSERNAAARLLVLAACVMSGAAFPGAVLLAGAVGWHHLRELRADAAAAAQVGDVDPVIAAVAVTATGPVSFLHPGRMLRIRHLATLTTP